MIRIALVDDHHLFRQGLRALLESEKRFAIVWEAATAKDALEQYAAKQPDVVVMDVGLPGISGILATRDLVRKHDARVLMLSMHGSEPFVIEALLAGATGFAMKTQRIDDIVTAVLYTHEKKLYLAPAIPRTVLDEYHRRIRGVSRGVLDVLSKRERDIFDLIVLNESNREISERLGISVKTVETHRMAINKKLGLHSTAEVIRFAAMHGLLHA